MGVAVSWIIAALFIWLVWRFVAKTMKAPSEPSPSPGDDAQVGAPLKPKTHGRGDAVAIEPEPEPDDDDLIGIATPLTRDEE
jgi:hypothetical protein